MRLDLWCGGNKVKNVNHRYFKDFLKNKFTIMASRILLINFTESEAKQLSGLPVLFERGFLSDIKKKTRQEIIMSSHREFPAEDQRRSVDDLDVYFPYPIYEYNAVFINLNNNEQLITEFKSKVRKFSNDDRKNFIKYWMFQGKPIICFLGDYSFDDLSNIGILKVSLKKVFNNDLSVNTYKPESGKEMAALSREIKKLVIMPTKNYISVGEKSPVDSDEYKPHPIFWNKNGDDLAVFVDYDKGYSPTDRPVIIIYPQFHNNAFVCEKVLFMLSGVYPILLPEIRNVDWKTSTDYFPREVSKYNEQIDELRDITEGKIDILKKSQKNAKEKYKNLFLLLTSQGDTLKDSILQIFKEVFKIEVIDSDTEKKQMLNEDMLINSNGERILVEVKGVKTQNPTPIYIGQLWKHIAKSSKKGVQRGALILNHDFNTKPEDRGLVYSGDDASALDDIIFIDTRVIHSLAIAIIDYGMLPSEAVEILLKNGRVEFNLSDYLKSKEK